MSLLLGHKEMTKFKYLWISIVAVLVVGCQTETDYGGAGTIGNFPYGGYSDYKINANTAVVTFRGNSKTCMSTIRSSVLNRCAEVTMANGYDWFIITSNSASRTNEIVETIDTYHRVNPPRFFDTYYRSSTFMTYHNSETSTQGYARPRQDNMCSIVMVIKMFRGRVPRGVPNAHSAIDVIGHLSGTSYTPI